MRFWNYDTRSEEIINLDAKTADAVLKSQGSNETVYTVTYTGYNMDGQKRNVLVTFGKTKSEERPQYYSATTFDIVYNPKTFEPRGAKILLNDGATERKDCDAIRSGRIKIARFEDIAANNKYISVDDEEQEEWENSEYCQYTYVLGNISEYNRQRYWNTIIPDEDDPLETEY